MKKLFILLLTVVMLVSFGMMVACKPEEPEDEVPTVSKFMINGFNEYDDIAFTYLNPKTFYGSFTRNKDKQFIVEGEGSYRYWVKKVHDVYQPNFEMKADRVKTDITDVIEFGMYIHSDADYEFEVVFKCQDATYGEIYKGVQKVVKGANNIVFPVERALLQDTGTAVTYYDLSFIGLKGDTVLYFDNLYATVTTEEIMVKPEVQEVIDEITILKASDRTAVESTYGKYKKLSPNDKKAVYNYKILRTMMLKFWNEDIESAKKQDPNTLVFFGNAFGEGQIKNVSEGVLSYDYVENLCYGNDQGSMKLTFQDVASSWQNMTTTVGGVVLAEGTYIEFYVYNDSDQDKGFEVDWTYPETGYLILKANEWTKISCEAKHLTARGYMVFTGLSETGSGEAPKGALYFSSIKMFNLKDIFEDERTEADDKTVFFFGEEIGQYQVYPQTNIGPDNLSIDTEKKAEGTLKVSVDNSESTSKTKQVELTYDVMDYKFTAGDLVYMDIYVDLVGADFAEIRWDSTHRTRAANKEWSTVVVDASHLVNAENKKLRIYACVYTDTSYDGIQFNGSVYLGKAKAAPASSVVDVNSVSEYTFGSQNIQYLGGEGTGTHGTLGNWTPNDSAYNQVGDKTPIIVANTMRFHLQGSNQARPVLSLKLKNAITLKSNTLIKVTIRGETKSGSDLQFYPFFNGASQGGRNFDNEITQGDYGYKTYTISFNAGWAGTKIDELTFWFNGNNKFNKPNYKLVSISDIIFENVTWNS